MVRKCRRAEGVNAKDGIGVSSTYMQLRSRRIDYVNANSRSENYSSGVVEDINEVSASNLSSSCASNDYRKFKDVEEEERDGDTETSTYRRNTKRRLFENIRDKESRKPMEISSVKESPDCCCGGGRTEQKVKSTTEQPTEAEIDEFFVEAEKKLQDKFKKKYNFDFDKEKPLEGRYEWIKLLE